ncbi:uncharacterized protein EDB91DRAFT_1085915 [Suillus paluster]|uniref:uncharacterized protein n=1 Tax=Suillus paluster TaxID=48578 RepID=UPI001B8819CD|nr:uncharacterized protein EDB91DRAFT_1085915 [Suillus paluster]KAG1728986.1 hypothetical protein EDB91DRAFT_1085915 [Suillus paluster]
MDSLLLGNDKTPPTATSPPMVTSPSNTVTPTPAGRTTRGINLSPDVLPVPPPPPEPASHTITSPHSDLAQSIHAPKSLPDDHQMSAPPSPSPTYTPNEEERAILDHLAFAEKNRSTVRHDGPHQCTTLPQFMPMPIGSFPHTHMSHSAQIFDHLDNQVLLAWFQVPHPKLVVQVFDHTGKDVVEKAVILAERICTKVGIVMNFVHQDAQPVRVSPPQPQGGKESKELPIGFLVHNISEEMKDLLLEKRIWSATSAAMNPPELLFCLTGFTTSSTQLVHKAVADIWASDETRAEINDIISMSEIDDEEKVYQATWKFIRSIRIEHLDFKVTGGLSIPRFNVFTVSPIRTAKSWTDLQALLRILDYPTSLDGCSTIVEWPQNWDEVHNPNSKKPEIKRETPNLPYTPPLPKINT